MGESDEGVSFTKREPEPREPEPEAGFDPYRFGAPEHPIPAEYAPPGYTGPTVPSAAASPYASPTANPFGNPPGTPYGGPPQYGEPPQYGAQPPYGGQPPYGSQPPYGYSAPPPPPYDGYPRPATGNGKAVAGLVFGILSIVLCFFSIFDGVLVILGLIFSTIALGETKDGRRQGRGLALAGLICAIIGGLLATLMTVIYVRVANRCGDLQDNRSQFQTCIRHDIF